MELIKVPDDDMSGYNIFENDLAIVDKSLSPDNGDYIYCTIDGEPQFRKYIIDKKAKGLYSSNDKIQPVFNAGTIVSKGVVTHTITPHIPTKIYPNGKGENSIDLNKLLIKNKASTFLGRIKGDSMTDARILDKDVAVIDKSLPYINGYKALCRIEDKYTVKFLEWSKDNKTLWLMPANENFEPIKETGNNNVEVWGVIAYTITSHFNFVLPE